MSDVFDALAHPVRRRILKMLRSRAMSAGAIAEQFDLAKPTMSGHFAVLKSADLVRTERKGTTIIYRLNMSVLEEATAALLDIAETHAPKRRGARKWASAPR